MRVLCAMMLSSCLSVCLFVCRQGCSRETSPSVKFVVAAGLTCGVHKRATFVGLAASFEAACESLTRCMTYVYSVFRRQTVLRFSTPPNLPYCTATCAPLIY